MTEEKAMRFEVSLEGMDDFLNVHERSFFVVESTGKIFVHSGIAPDSAPELSAYLGIPVVFSNENLYIDADWMGKQYPETKETIEIIENIYRKIPARPLNETESPPGDDVTHVPPPQG